MIRAEVSWWPGNIETESGLHIHHLVWGIALMTIGGFLGFAPAPGAPWYQLAALAFGIGGGLTADEFALWVRLDDVYWSEEGRVSLDAVILVSVFMALVVIGTKPFGLSRFLPIGLTAFAVVQALALSVISFLKGRIALGVIAVFVPGSGCGPPVVSPSRTRRGSDASTARRRKSARPRDSRQTAREHGFALASSMPSAGASPTPTRPRDTPRWTDAARWPSAAIRRSGTKRCADGARELAPRAGAA